MKLPFVSVLVPCRNEEKFIAKCLDSLIQNDYPKDRMEIIVIDGMSSDNTKGIVLEYRANHSFIILIDNPKKSFPSAVNCGLKSSTGNPVLIIGSHACYNENYLSKCVEYSLKTNAENVGGILITQSQGNTTFGEVIVKVLTSKFGVGNSVFRIGSAEVKDVDTVFGGCYKREVFDKIGYLNEDLISTSDYEFNARLIRNGGRILLVPEIKAYYYTRSTLRKFMANNFRNGFWAIYPLAFLNYIPVSIRHFIPLIFVLALSFSLALSFFYAPAAWLFISIFAAYFIAAFSFSINEKKVWVILMLPIFFLLLHMTYGLGSLFALLKIPFAKISSTKPQ